MDFNFDKNKKGNFVHLEDILENKKGNILSGLIILTASIPICAYVGSNICGGVGYLFGNIIDNFPYLCDVAPLLAERSGLIQESFDKTKLNENLYQTTGALAGFWCGALLPWRVLSYVRYEKI